MNCIDVSKVEDEKGLDLINCKNFTQFNDITFFENVDANIEKIIYDVGLDEASVQAISSTKHSYKEILAKYEENYLLGLTKKNKTLIGNAYEYAIMFMNSAFVTYGDDIVSADDIVIGTYVFAELYDRFKPEELPYGNLDGFVDYYKTKNHNIVLERKKG